jgi:hypothetical protein
MENEMSAKKAEIVLYRAKRSIKFFLGDLLAALGVLKPAFAVVPVKVRRK